jgi:twitching motility two-component system response regulator PilH
VKVLVVDDNEDLRRLMSSALTYAGHQIEECPGGDEAVRYLRATTELPAAIVLDVQMPVVDGWRTLATIREDDRTSAIPVVMCTVKSRMEDVIRGWEMGCDGYLVKPFDLDGFVREVEAVAGRDQQERELVREQRLSEIAAQLTN